MINSSLKPLAERIEVQEIDAAAESANEGRGLDNEFNDIVMTMEAIARVILGEVIQAMTC
jgi:hypothetical protein